MVKNFIRRWSAMSNNERVMNSLAQRMENVIRSYINACNDAASEAITECFCPDAVCYTPGYKRSGAAAIGSGFAKMVREQGVFFTVDQLITDVDRFAAALEWTAFIQPQAAIIRGVDWFDFDPQTFRIKEVRTYTAAPFNLDILRQELFEFNYEGRGYPTTFPIR